MSALSATGRFRPELRKMPFGCTEMRHRIAGMRCHEGRFRNQFPWLGGALFLQNWVADLPKPHEFATAEISSGSWRGLPRWLLIDRAARRLQAARSCDRPCHLQG